MSQAEVLASIKEHVSYCKARFDIVQFSPEDATRTELPFLLKCVQTAVDAGASIINIPDTVGYSYPSEYGNILNTSLTMFKQLKTLSIAHIVMMILV